MQKSLLITSTKKNLSLLSKQGATKLISKSHPVHMLNNFLTTSIIQKLADQENISFKMFKNYLRTQGKTATKILTPSYLASGEAGAALFKEFMQENLKKENVSDTQNYFALGELPEDAQQTILSFLDKRTMAVMSMTSTTFNQETKHIVYWHDKLIEAGCDIKLLEHVVTTETIQDYKHLYHVFSKMSYNDRIKITEPWELYCLSGEVNAMFYAIEHEGLTKETKSKNGNNALLYAARGGSVAGIDFANKILKIPANSANDLGYNPLLYAAYLGNVAAIKHSSKDLDLPPTVTAKDKANIHHFAALSGSLSALKHTLKNFKKPNPNSLTEYGENLLHCAGKSGSVKMMEFLIDELKFDPNVVDKNGETFLHYAIRSNDIDAAEHAFKKFKNADANWDPLLVVNKEGENLLHVAAKDVDIKMMDFLVKIFMKNKNKEEQKLLINAVNKKVLLRSYEVKKGY